MTKIANELIGNTPLIRLCEFIGAFYLKHPVIAKAEFFNPLPSVKGRVAFFLIDAI